jgi:ubiquinone/menaquinone biosynthesis C-methylase UbiE
VLDRPVCARHVTPMCSIVDFAAPWSNLVVAMFSLFRFRRGSRPVDLAIGMAGVRMRERLLQVGVGDPAIFAANAAKVGLTGRACAVVDAPAAAAALERAAAEEGVLVEVSVAHAGDWPYEEGSFDVALVDGNMVAALDGEARSGLLAEVRRVMRVGGRVLAISRSPRGLAIRLGFETPAVYRGIAESLTSSLAGAGFHPIRCLAAREGMTFVEAFRPRV